MYIVHHQPQPQPHWLVQLDPLDHWKFIVVEEKVRFHHTSSIRQPHHAHQFHADPVVSWSYCHPQPPLQHQASIAQEL
jgi:hypothetical protein